MSFTTLITEGNLIPADLLERLAAGEVAGQQPADFGLDKNRRLTDEIAAAWADARAYWEAFQRRLRRLKEDDPATSDTREYWIEPLLESLGYQLTYMREAAVVNNQTYALSHRAGEDESGPPVHIEGLRRSLDQRPPSGRPRLSPHALMQEYLNATEHLWGIVTNGEKLRLLRDSSRTTRPTFVEFDLRAMLEGEKFSEFALFYRLVHRTRLPKGMEDAAGCWLEKYHQQALEAGGRVREGLRVGVETALRELGNGLLQHPASATLRSRLAPGGQLDAANYYRQLLRLVYRLLFLMVAEERGLISGSEQGLKLYREFYSVTRLRRLAEQPGAGRGRNSDLWLGLLATFEVLKDDRGGQALGVTPLDGDLFGPEAIRDLETAQLYNEPFLKAVRALSLYRDQDSKVLRRVNYSALDVEELGSVYESLLDYRPVITSSPSENASTRNSELGNRSFDLVTGTERKTTGSYYTRPELVHELIVSALEPVLEDRLAAAGSDKAAREKAILSITVCDPASGSGHFLLAAARRLGRELAKVRSGEDQPNPEQFRRAVRDVISRCIYGVDVNPLAVDLCKLALWLEGYNAGMPLSFLDSHIRWGNSLIGARRELVEAGIPEEAYQAVTGDDKTVATAFKKRNKTEREARKFGQKSMFNGDDNFGRIVEAARQLDVAPDTSVEAVRAKADEYRRLREQEFYDWTLFNLWTAVFFLPLTDSKDATIPTSQAVFRYREAPKAAHAQMIGRANGLALELGFFHWELEFPQVFDRGGFDVVLGNPPWEKIKLQEEEHWADDPYIASARNKDERTRRILEYRASNNPLKQARVAKFDVAKYRAGAESRYMRHSGNFPLTAVGDINTYAIFSERVRNLMNAKGRVGIIVPTGIATADTYKHFFGDLVQSKSLVSYFGFKNEEFLFAKPVEHTVTFGLLTVLGSAQTSPTMKFTWLCYNVEHMHEPKRRLILTPDDLKLFNPNTYTSPVFRTEEDVPLTRKVYNHIPILVNERTGENPWDVSFMTMFHMSNDSKLFSDTPNYNQLPLYEAKLTHQFNHRWATFEGVNSDDLRKGFPATSSSYHLTDPNYSVTPRYWVSNSEVERRLTNSWERRWLLGFRDICRSTDERTAIFSLMPKVGVGNKIPLLLSPKLSVATAATCFLATANSLTFDFITRQKLPDATMNYFIVKQLPVLPPQAFSKEDVGYISERVLELIYTAWDVQPFAADLWAELDEAGRALVLARWSECNGTTQPTNPHEVPSPFIWNEERRAHIRAELDARIARLYGLTRGELRYILDPADVYGPDFPGETFRVLKEKEIKQYGEYRTRRLVLEKWDAEEQNGSGSKHSRLTKSVI